MFSLFIDGFRIDGKSFFPLLSAKKICSVGHNRNIHLHRGIMMEIERPGKFPWPCLF